MRSFRPFLFACLLIVGSMLASVLPSPTLKLPFADPEFALHIPWQVRSVDALINPFVGTPQTPSCTVSAAAATCSMTISTALKNVNGGLVFPNGGDPGGSGTQNAAEFHGTYLLTSTTNIDFTRRLTTSTASIVAKAFVWELNPFFLKQAIQRGTVEMTNSSATTGTTAITAVVTANSAIVGCGMNVDINNSTQFNNPTATSIWLDFSDTTHVRVNRHTGDGTTIPRGCFQVVERR